MGVLLSFNSSPTQGFQDLVSSTGLPEKELQRQLASLCETKILQTEVSPGISCVCVCVCKILEYYLNFFKTHILSVSYS